MLTLEFIALAAAMVLWLRITHGWLRLLGFLAGCLTFAASYLTPIGALSTGIFVAMGYGLARLVKSHPEMTVGAIATMVGSFVYLRGYDFLLPLLPEGIWGELIATAGLSYLLFKMLHVIVDSASGIEVRPLLYLAYCLNFTTFLLGPIQRYPDFVRQWNGEEDPLEPRFEAHLGAANRVLRGLVKKFVIAERIAPYALLPHASASGMELPEVILGAWVFYLYLYFDFSGYCDIMIGIGRLMGVAPPENFYLPMFSPNIAQYWLRVHRSLTEWLTDYVFHPTYTALLRSERFGRRRLLCRNAAIACAMLIAGVWHGTTLSFLLFGLVHAVYQVIFRSFEELALRRLGRKGLARLRRNPIWACASIALTFVATGTAFIFFVLDPPELLALTGLSEAR